MRKLIVVCSVIGIVIAITLSVNLSYATPSITMAVSSASKINQPTSKIILQHIPLENNHGLILTDIGLWLVDTISGQWKQIYTPTSNIVGVSAVDSSHIWIIANEYPESPNNPLDYRIYFTSDMGSSWETSSLYPKASENWYPDIAPTKSITFIDNQHGWIVLQEVTSAAFSLGWLFRTNDGGKTWIKLSTPSAVTPSFLNKDIGWTVDPHKYTLYRTIDGGETWQQEALPGFKPDSNWLEMSPPTIVDGKGYLRLTKVGESSSTDIIYTLDSGRVAWSKVIELPPSEDKAATILFDNDKWVAFYANGASKISTDGGKSWKDQVTSYSLDQRMFVVIQQTSPQHAWASAAGQFCFKKKADCTQYDIVYETDDGGLNWAPVIDLITHSDQAR